jgi:hypothetical protein
LKNSLELLNSQLKNLTLKFNKFLQSQSQIIKSVEQRRNNLSGGINTLKKNKNEYVYTSLPNNDYYNENDNQKDQDDLLELENQQTTIQFNSNKNAYYQERSNAVNYVERMMNDLSSMFSRISQIAYEQRSMIEK